MLPTEKYKLWNWLSAMLINCVPYLNILQYCNILTYFLGLWSQGISIEMRKTSFEYDFLFKFDNLIPKVHLPKAFA